MQIRSTDIFESKVRIDAVYCDEHIVIRATYRPVDKCDTKQRIQFNLSRLKSRWISWRSIVEPLVVRVPWIVVVRVKSSLYGCRTTIEDRLAINVAIARVPAHVFAWVVVATTSLGPTVIRRAINTIARSLQSFGHGVLAVRTRCRASAGREPSRRAVYPGRAQVAFHDTFGSKAIIIRSLGTLCGAIAGHETRAVTVDSTWTVLALTERDPSARRAIHTNGAWFWRWLYTHIHAHYE